MNETERASMKSLPPQFLKPLPEEQGFNRHQPPPAAV
jgi:hypothetical protein